MSAKSAILGFQDFLESLSSQDMVRLFVFGLFNDVISNPAPVASDDGISE
jgi:hypothetical protein